MADNVAITAGSGTTIHADEYTHTTFGSGKTQLVKLVDGTVNGDTGIASGGGVEASALRVTIANDSTGLVSVDDNGGSLTTDSLAQKVDDASFTPATDSVVMAGYLADETATDTVDEGDAGAARMDTSRRVLMRLVGSTDANRADVDGSGHLQVDIAASSTSITVADGGGSLTVDNNGTFAVQASGTVAHDSADSGNPVKVGAKASATLSDDTMVANGDRTDLTSDLDGAVLFRSQFPLGDLLAERVTDTTGTSTAFSTFGATASTRSYVTAISVYNTSATAGYIDFRDGTGGSVLWTVPIPAGGGAVISSPHPLFRTSANTALAYDVSGALTTVYISISGFKSKV